MLDERDGGDEPRTSVINETMARRYFPDRTPVGQTIVNPHGKSVVVGVVGDVRNQGLDREPRKQVYLPLQQSPAAGMAVVARTARDPLAIAAALREAVWAVDADQPIYELSTMDQILARAVFLPRMSTTLLSLFAAAALLLATVGLYGVLSYAVSQRTREIGLRMALGAPGRRVIALVAGNTMAMLAAGIGLGLVAAALLARSMGGVLYGISRFDLPAFAIGALALAAAGFVARWCRRGVPLGSTRSSRCETVVDVPGHAHLLGQPRRETEDTMRTMVIALAASLLSPLSQLSG